MGHKPNGPFLRSSSSSPCCSRSAADNTSLNARLVRRRLRHIAMRGTIVHKNYFYGSVTLLPVTSAFAVIRIIKILGSIGLKL